MTQATQGSVNMVSTRKTESYAINGQIANVQQAVARFVGKNDFSGLSIRLNNANLSREGMNQPLRDGDTIFVAESNIASAGFKGAN